MANDTPPAPARTDEAETLTPRHGAAPAPVPLADPALLQAGALLGRYSVLVCLGQGGMGTVYAAYDPQLDRRVALKVLRPDLLAGLSLEQSRALLLKEARAMARLSHPNVVGVHEADEVNGLVYVAMDFVDGGTLSAWLRRLPVPRDWRAVLPQFIQAGRGLAAAHAAGLVHRDFKPDNVLMTRDGRARVSDFGLAAPSDAGGRIALVGTPGYMAPEQYQRQPADERTDVYAFCAALWEGLHGQLPLAQAPLAEMAEAAAQGRFRAPPPQSAVPRWLHRALLSGLAPRREERPTLRALLDVLSRDRAGDRRRLLAAGVGLAVGLTAGGVGLSLKASPCGGAALRWKGVWDPARRDAAQAAFAAQPGTFAAQAFDGAAAVLDGYRARWIAMETEACQATRVDGSQSESVLGLRELCLDRSLEQARGLTELFTHPDPDVIERSGEAVRTLPPLAECADVVALAGRVAQPPDAVAAGVQALRQRLAGGEALRSAGRYEAARTEALAVARAAEPLHYPPLLAEALTLAGTAGYNQARYVLARADLEAAVLAGEQAPQSTETLVRAWTWRELVDARQGEQAQARLASRHAHAFLSAVARPDALSGALALADGVQEFTGGSTAVALTDFQEALRLRRLVLGPDSPEVGKALNNLGAAANVLGQYADAERYIQQSIALTERTLGPDHPQLAEPLTNLSRVYRAQGNGPASEAAARRSLAIKEAAYGAGGAPTLLARAAVAWALFLQQRVPEARAMMVETLAMARRNGKVNANEAFVQLQDLAFLEYVSGQDDAALAHLTESTQVARDHFPLNERLAKALVTNARPLLDRGRLAEAEAMLDEEQRIAKHLGYQPADTGPWLDFALARARLAHGGDRAAFAAAVQAVIASQSDSHDLVRMRLVEDARAALARSDPDGGR